MKTLKNKIILILGLIIAILCIANTTEAASYSGYNVGDVLSKSYYDYITDTNLFCVQHGQRLPGYDVTYRVNSIVTIKGLNSVNTANNTRVNNSKINATFAYILSQNNGTEGAGIDKDQGPVANAIWTYAPTWVRSVGTRHGISQAFVSGNAGSSLGNSLIAQAQSYANSINTSTLEDNTNKSQVKATAVEVNGKQYTRVGPFKWSFPGSLSGITVYDQNEKAISGVAYGMYSGSTFKTVSVKQIKSDKNFYVLIPIDKSVSKITRISGSCNYDVKSVKIWFLESISGASYQNLMAREPYTSSEKIHEDFEYDISLLGHLKVIKIVEGGDNVTLSGVGFIIQNKDTGKYVKQNSNGVITYVDSRSQATEFITNANGEFTVKNLLVGKYLAYETKNPNYGYELKTEATEGTVVVDKTSNLNVSNIQKYIKLSGYVWLDKQSEKQAIRNDLYNDGEFDYEDKLLNGIPVRLKDKSGNTIMETVTADRGAYQFVDVLVENLGNYYIEFEYDGLTFTNVVPYIDKDNGSKAAENEDTRRIFNNNFSIVEGTGGNAGITKDSNGNKVHDLTYTKNSEEYKSILNNVTYVDENAEVLTLADKGNYPITALTEETGYNILDHYVVGQEEIKYINLGLYEREQPDLALVKDLDNVSLSINGYGHTYNYGTKSKEAQNDKNDESSIFNVGVKFGEKYSNMTYSRAIYESDYTYTDEDTSRELKVRLTYKITLKNQSTNLVSQINSIVDYYDKRYTIVGAGTGIDNNGNLSGNLNCTEDAGYSSSKYNKVIIETNSNVEAQKQNDIYVQFELSREAVANIIDEHGTEAGKDNLLENVVEINSYSVFDKEGNQYAGIDVDSNPGNANPEDTKTFEDDTDRAPALRLEVADARRLTGKVFLDGTDPQLKTGEERLGSGQYEDGELGIPGVEVTLKENKETYGMTYKTTTVSEDGKYILKYKYIDYSGKEIDPNGEIPSGTTVEITPELTTSDNNDAIDIKKGDFYIREYIPGDYTLTYTWGDETYTVQNYKGTVYSKDRYDANSANKEWYKSDVDTRWTDAIDDYTQRQAIDNELKTIINSTTPTITKMDSTTPTMGITVENTDMAVTDATGDKLVYEVRNVDFGIVERPRQEVELIKRVSRLKLTLANGQVLTEAELDDEGNIIKETSTYVTAGPPSVLNTQKPNGFVQVQIDKELMQGSTLEVEYKIIAKNISELDYTSEEYYKYGINKEPVVTITPTAIIDYLDKDWEFEESRNQEGGWEIKTPEEAEQLQLLGAEVINSETINESIILYTEKLKDQALQPTQSASVNLIVSKVLAVTDEIDFNNHTEIVKIDKTGGSDIISSTPGNYIPGESDEFDSDMAQSVTVTPPTGENRNFIIITGVIVGALIITAVGIIVIKKKTLNK